jgi:hypothetical protein
VCEGWRRQGVSVGAREEGYEGRVCGKGTRGRGYEGEGYGWCGYTGGVE